MIECPDSPDEPGPLPLARIESLINSALAKISRHFDNPCPSTQATLLETVAHGQVVKRYDHHGHLVVPIPEKKRVKRKALAGLPKDVRVIPAHIQGSNGKTLEREIEQNYADYFGEAGSGDEKENFNSGRLMHEEERGGSIDMDRMSSPGAPPTQGFTESLLAARVSGGNRSLWDQVGGTNVSSSDQPFRGTEDGRSGGSSFGGKNQQSAEIEEDELDSQPEEFDRQRKRRRVDVGDDESSRVGGFRSSLLAGRGGRGSRLWDASGA